MAKERPFQTLDTDASVRFGPNARYFLFLVGTLAVTTISFVNPTLLVEAKHALVFRTTSVLIVLALLAGWQQIAVHSREITRTGSFGMLRRTDAYEDLGEWETTTIGTDFDLPTTSYSGEELHRFQVLYADGSVAFRVSPWLRDRAACVRLIRKRTRLAKTPR